MIHDFQYAYFVNKEKKQVVCILKNKHNLKENRVGVAQRFCSVLYSNYVSENIDFQLVPSQCIAIAKCHPEDMFNEETGKRIARNKLRTRLLTAVYNKIKQKKNMFDSALLSFEKFKR